MGVVFVQGVLYAQVDSTAVRYAATITIEELKEHLGVLASDAYMGRDTGKEGQKMAAAYLKAEFQAMGIPPVPPAWSAPIKDGYFQPFELVEERLGSISLEAGGSSVQYPRDLLYFNERLAGDHEVSEVIYVGNASRLASLGGIAGGVVVVEDPGGDAEATVRALRELSKVATEAGVRAVLIVTGRMEALQVAFMPHGAGSRMRLADGPSARSAEPAGAQLLFIEASNLDPLLGRKPVAKLRRSKPGKKVAARFTLKKGDTAERVESENVLAYIEGTDKKDEVLVITAHYDHIGIEDGVVYNGADDDGSGTVAIMAIADAFAQAKAAGHGPRRSVLVMPVSGEEKGLLGSRYYSENPVFPLENTIANLNIDMIGRRDSVHRTSAPYVYVIGSDRLSDDLHTANETANEAYARLALDYTFNAEDDPNRFYYRSDHYNFARKGVPAIFYFSGVHEDYHGPGDDVDKIEFDLLHQRTLLVFHTAWILANAEERPVLNGSRKQD